MDIQKSGEHRLYTEEYIEDKRKDILEHQRKYAKIALRKLLNHCIHPEEEVFVPEQIKFMTRNLMNIVMTFEREALETFNNLPEEDRVRLTADYLKNKEYKTMIKENPAIRSTPPELIEDFYNRQAELDKETREQAIKFINRE